MESYIPVNGGPQLSLKELNKLKTQDDESQSASSDEDHPKQKPLQPAMP